MNGLTSNLVIDEMITAVTNNINDSGYDINLENAREEIRTMLVPLLEVAKENGDTPMGVSQWKSYGEKYGYWDFFNKEICICAAIKLNDGTIVRGHRHSDCFHAGVAEHLDKNELMIGDQGFITSRNRYVTREEGRKLQDAAGIPSASPDGYQKGTLFSEDLY